MQKFISSILTISFCLTVALSGCGGSGGGNSSNGTGGGNGTVSGNLAYVNSSNGITAYSIDDATGVLKPISGVNYEGENMFVNPDGKFIYCYNRSFKLRTYAVNSQTSVLTMLGEVSVPSEGYRSATVHPEGKAVYVLDSFKHNITVYSINNNGTIGSNMGSKIELPDPYVTDKIAVDPYGKFACIGSYKDAGEVRLNVYSINSKGGLTAQSPIVIKEGSDEERKGVVGCDSVAFDPNGQYALVNLRFVDGNQGRPRYYNKLYTYSITSGTWELFSRSDSAEGDMVFSPNGKFVYFVSSDKITFAKFHADGLEATNISVNDKNANSLTFDPTGKFAYVAYDYNGEDNDKVGCYTVNSDTGVLTHVSSITVGSSPKSIVTIKR